jgi:hypothetical protein
MTGVLNNQYLHCVGFICGAVAVDVGNDEIDLHESNYHGTLWIPLSIRNVAVPSGGTAAEFRSPSGFR